jgi:hypothetical protein
MASTTFADAVNALVAERDRQFITRIATEYNLDFAELNAKYLETAAAAIKVPKKYKKREPKAVTVVTVADGDAAAPAPKAKKEPKAAAVKQCCTAQTSKKEACKFSALKGEVFCKRHLKQSLGESSPEPKEAKQVKKPAKKPEQPVHTHPLEEPATGDCDLCASHGNPLEGEHEFEVVGPVKVQSVQSRLAALLAVSEEDGSSDDEGSDAGGLAEEEFEDDD